MRFLQAIVFVLACPLFSQAQTSPGNINKYDNAGKRVGMWVLSQPERMGEDAYSEIGTYDHGLKYGPWYKLDKNGELEATETYKNDVLDGEAKYFEGGFLIAVGNYRGLNPLRERDTFMVEHPITGEQSLRSVATDRGSVKHGMWRFYDPETGRLIREEDYQVDELVYSKEFPMSQADSLYYKKQAEKMPHNRKAKYYKPPVDKQFSYFK